MHATPIAEREEFQAVRGAEPDAARGRGTPGRQDDGDDRRLLNPAVVAHAPSSRVRVHGRVAIRRGGVRRLG